MSFSPEDAARVFDAIDKDGNGKLSKQELGDYCTKLHIKWSDVQKALELHTEYNITRPAFLAAAKAGSINVFATADHGLAARNTSGATHMVKVLQDKKSWDDEVADTRKAGKKLVVDFTASWCGPCQKIGPKFVEMAESGDFPNLVFVKVNVHEGKKLDEGGFFSLPGFLQAMGLAPTHAPFWGEANLHINAMPTFRVYDCAKMDGDGWPTQVGEVVGGNLARLKEMCSKNN